MDSPHGYFNTPEYLEYLLKNFEVEGWADASGPDANCPRPSQELVEGYVRRLAPRPGERLLEVGCGLGRLLDRLRRRHAVAVSGVDVSEEAVRLARQRLGPECELRTASAEALPFPSASFDLVVCWGVFDLTEQSRALTEMLRVLRVGGRLLLTGKNDRFMDDDTEARAAEEGSRRKGIPNHYTDFDRLLTAISANGGVVQLSHFFLRRGDFAAQRAHSKRPQKFIEYCLIVAKTTEVDPVVPPALAERSSRTWRELHA